MRLPVNPKHRLAPSRLAKMVLLSSACIAGMPDAWAMAKAPAANGGSCSANSGMTTPNPARKVVLGTVGTIPFTLPNGSKVDLTADLATLFNTAVTGTQVYFPTDAATATDPCGTHLEVSAAVSTLELNAVQIGVTFGYTPSGTSSVVTGATGSVNVNIGTIAMDFSVRQCTNGGCTTIGAVSSDAVTAGVSTSFTIDLGTVTTGPSLVYNTDLGKIITGIMNDGAKKLVAAANPSLLSWSATVREVTAGSSIIFDAGTQALLLPNQTFAVYAVTPATGVCSVYQAMANVHTTQVEPLSSTAQIDTTLDPRGVQVGDLVVIRPAGSTN